MKSISASIIVMSGVVCFYIANSIAVSDTATFLMAVGTVIVAFGLFGWIRSTSGSIDISQETRRGVLGD